MRDNKEIGNALLQIAEGLKRIANEISKDEADLDYSNTSANNPNNQQFNNKEHENQNSEQSPYHEEVEKITAQWGDINNLLRFISEKNAEVIEFNDKRIEENPLTEIANLMGNKYNYLYEVYNVIKSRLQGRVSFNFYLKDKSQETMAVSTMFCHKLHELTFLSHYKYFKSPKYTIQATTNNVPTGVNFLTGGWLEIFIISQIEKAIIESGKNISYCYIQGLKTKFENNDISEFDIWFDINGYYYWFEAKTGSYQNYLQKYSDLAKKWGITENTFVVLSDISKETADQLNNIYEINVIDIEGFLSLIDYFIDFD